MNQTYIDDNNFTQRGTLNEFLKWIEPGWWTSREALAIFLGYSRYISENSSFLNQLIMHLPGSHIANMINIAVRAKEIKNNVIEPQLWSNRAPCKDWLEWGLTKPSIAQNLNPELLEAAGIKTDKIPRDNTSYRPGEEKLVKNAFIAISKSILFICPKARLEDIIGIINNAKAIEYLPKERTLRKWLAEKQVTLLATNQTDIEKLKIEKKLSPEL